MLGGAPLPDWAAYVARLTAALATDGADDAPHVSAVRALFDAVAAKSGATDGAAVYVGEAGLGCVGPYLARGAARLAAAGRVAPPLFRYVFRAWLPECPACQVLNRSTHGTDVRAMQFVPGLSPAHAATARALWRYVANFGETGDPSAGPWQPPAPWPRYAPGGPAPTVLAVDDGGAYALLHEYQEEHCLTLLRTGLL